MMETNENKKNIDRRSFLKKAWAWLGIVAGIEFMAVTFSFLSSRKKSPDYVHATQIKTAGTIESIAHGSVIPFKNGRFYLVRMEDGGFLALSLACTHLGCAISFEGQKNEFVCPCHSSAFDMAGNVVKPPATRALDTYRVFFERGNVMIDTSKKNKRRRFSPDDLVYA